MIVQKKTYLLAYYFWWRSNTPLYSVLYFALQDVHALRMDYIILKKIDGLGQQICDVIESDCKLELNDGSKRNNAYEERTHASSSKGPKLLNQQKRFQCENERNLTKLHCGVCRFK